jgi:hypothetical protein
MEVQKREAALPGGLQTKIFASVILSLTVASRHSLLPKKNGPQFYVTRVRSRDVVQVMRKLPGNEPLVDVAMTPASRSKEAGAIPS